MSEAVMTVAPIGRTGRVSLRATLRILGLLFVGTGCTGLLAEQCFEKLLTTLVGASTPAAAIVLSVYFLGLTAGALSYPLLRRMGRTPLRTYGILEGGIGLWTVGLAVGTPYLIDLLVPMLRLGLDRFWLLQGLRFLCACLWILPPTFLMGATFPAIIDALEVGRIPGPRKAISLFYSLNLAGAILGGVLGPYLLIPVQGLRGTLLLVGFIDLLVAGSVAWIIERGTRLECRQIMEQPTAIAEEHESWSGMVRGSLLLLWIGFFSGFLFFSLEVIWTHLITAVLGNSVYAFASMLVIVLVSLGIGGMMATVLFKDGRPCSPATTGFLLIFGSLLLAWQSGRWDDIPGKLVLLGKGLQTFTEGEWIRWLQAAGQLLPSAVVFGMVFPTLFRMDLFPGKGRARMAALLAGVNALGCVCGALLCGFILIPLLGSERTMAILGILALVSGVALLAAVRGGTARFVIGLAAVLPAMAWVWAPPWNRLALTSGGHVYFTRGFVTPNSRLEFFHEDTMGGMTTVVSEQRLKTLLTNGKFQANDGNETHAQTGFALVPTLHVGHPGKALVIGLGSGNSAAVVRSLGYSSIDVAEISPGIIQAAREQFAHINGRILDQSGVRLHLEDGRNFLLLNDTGYDLITMEINSVWFAGSTNLYSREFYDLCRRRLNPGGVFQQWIQMHHIGPEELGSVIATLRDVFPEVSFWKVGGQGILVGSVSPQAIQETAVERYFRGNPWKLGTREEQRTRLQEILAMRLLAPSDLDRYLEAFGFEINTDSNRYLEYASPKYNLDRRPLEQVNTLFIGRFSTFPPHRTEPASSTGLADVIGMVTPAFQKATLGLP